MGNCLVCGKPTEKRKPPWKGERKYCSKDCAVRSYPVVHPRLFRKHRLKNNNIEFFRKRLRDCNAAIDNLMARKRFYEEMLMEARKSH